MVPEYIECCVQLLFILIALLVSLFRYISSRKKGWLYSAGYFAGSLLSSFFWSVYLIIMGEDPNASSFLTYFGWNTSFLVMLLMNRHLKEKEERKYFNPLMLLPIPLNAVQLKLYLQFDGAALSVYQVSVCTLIACSCIQSILWYLKKRKSGAKPPYVAIVSLINILAEFGMWTSTCFEGRIHDLYYPFSFLSSLTYLLILRALSKRYAGEKDVVTGEVISRKIQNIMKCSYMAIVLICSLGGFFLGRWVRDTLSCGDYENSETDIYGVLSVILFLISIILVAFAITIILIVYFEQKITENNRLREEKLIAESSNAAKSEFLANMSHEIRTPLNAVLGLNKMINLESRGAAETPPEDRAAIRWALKNIMKYSDNIDSAGNSLLSIINDILDFSKIEAGKLDLTEHEYTLSSVLNDVCNMVQFRTREKGLDLNMEIAEDIPERLFGDDMRIRQIICNILNNAVKYTDRGSVTLAMNCAEPPAADKPTELIIKVSDTGIGIKKEDLEKIFDKFERTDLEHNSTVEGTGLGLAITVRLLEMMGGKIGVKSEYGSGTTFTIRLPQRVISPEPIGDFRKRFINSSDTALDSECLFRAPEARILIVDDTKMNLTVAAGLIKDTEIKTDFVESGAAALEMVQKNSYDLILLDQRMPIMDGTETLAKLRELGFTAPVICLTADALSGAREQYLAKGFDDYLSKPIDSLDMKRTIMKHLPKEKLLPAGDSYDGSHREAQDNEPFGCSDPLISALRKARLNTVKALGYCQNDAALYRMLLGEFVRGAKEKADGLQKYFDSGDSANYAILVHSLKSSSKTIGGDELSELALELEKAADANKWDILKEKHSRLLSDLDELVKIITDTAGEELSEAADDVSADDDILEFFPDE
ncbi:MAG: response regulator [Ruminococcus sp.]|nr:response regulator [Ruminococcus sp.]